MLFHRCIINSIAELRLGITAETHSNRKLRALNLRSRAWICFKMIRIRLKIKHKNSHFHKIVLINFFGDAGSIYWWLFDFINGYTNTIKSHFACRIKICVSTYRDCGKRNFSSFSDSKWTFPCKTYICWRIS